MTTPTTILVVFGTRPEAIKLFPVVATLKADPRFSVKVCVSAQHREMLDQVLEIAGIVPDHDLDVMKPDQSLDALTASLLTGLGKVMDQVRPDRVIVQGDTATAMAGALAAYYRKVPVDHVEAGLRSGNIYHPWPEEINRKIIGAMASLHFAPTETSAAELERARSYLIGSHEIAMQRRAAVANAMAYHEAYGLGWQAWNGYDAAIRAVRPEDVAAAAAAYLRPDRMITATVAPPSASPGAKRRSKTPEPPAPRPPARRAPARSRNNS
jgi:hypothetical protein